MGLIKVNDHTDLFRADGGTLYWQYDAEKLRIDAWGEDGLRVRATQREQFEHEDWALLSGDSAHARIEIDADGARITNGKLTAEMSNVGRITFRNAGGKILLQEFLRNRADYSADYCSALDIDAREFYPILGGDYALTARFESDPSEKLYGMGQYQQPYLNLKG